MTLHPVTSSLLETPGVAHGFFGRAGGVSSGAYGSLNCGPGSEDSRLNVIENRARVADTFGVRAKSLLTTYQIHSARVVAVDRPWADQRPEADAMVTRTPGLALGILTADCGPILFSDPKSGVIGAAHAGWKGALAGVLEATIDAMVGLGAEREDIQAVVGPTISAENYEVGPEFHERFLAAQQSNATYFRRSDREGHFKFDLPHFILDRLERAAIGDCVNTGLCTYGLDKDYFSYRRSTHLGEGDSGRNISVIMLREAR